MTKRSRRTHTPAFKARVALASLKGDKTLAELAQQFDWSPTLPSAGDYAVYAKWQAADDRATDATYEIAHSGGVDQVTVDQTHNGGEWRYLGTWSFDPSQTPKVSLLASLDGTGRFRVGVRFSE